ncbi:MAG: zinc transporter ZitB [Acidimicrobiales bacterium]|nr:MAG: zinc transporter ZitB [Acidimicrobiales bacterium]
MAHHHDHSPGSPRPIRDLTVAAGANTVLLVVQVVGAIAFGSIALLADSIHQGSDVVSLFLAVGIAAVVARPPSGRFTFGFRRADALGGLLHCVLLLAGAVWIVIEAIRRFDGDHEVEGLGVVVLALVGLAVNGFSARWLHMGHGHSLNVEGAVLHLAADAAGSLVVLIGGVLVLTTGADWVDPAASLVVTVLIVWSALRLGATSLRVLMDAVPEGVDMVGLRTLMLDDPLVTDAHHLHVRTLDGDTVSLTAHVQVDTEDLHEAQVVTERLSIALGERGIDHVTLQAECHPCEGEDC